MFNFWITHQRREELLLKGNVHEYAVFLRIEPDVLNLSLAVVTMYIYNVDTGIPMLRDGGTLILAASALWWINYGG